MILGIVEKAHPIASTYRAGAEVTEVVKNRQCPEISVIAVGRLCLFCRRPARPSCHIPQGEASDLSVSNGLYSYLMLRLGWLRHRVSESPWHFYYCVIFEITASPVFSMPVLVGLRTNKLFRPHRPQNKLMSHPNRSELKGTAKGVTEDENGSYECQGAVASPVRTVWRTTWMYGPSSDALRSSRPSPSRATPRRRGEVKGGQCHCHLQAAWDL